MTWVSETVKDTAKVAEATTKAGFRALMVTAIPIIELGLLAFLTYQIVALPTRLVKRNG